jgi:alkylation response protein AidB-like acyl-CoA dehydrogenase
MDFAFTDDQVSLRDLARQILTEQATHEHLAALEKQSWSVFDRPLWHRLADAGITGIAVPEDRGGAGQGFIEIAVVAEEVGRTVAPVPVVPTLVTAYVLARNGQGDDVLAGVASGDVILTTAFGEPGDTTATPDGAGLRLTGEKHFVPYGGEADAVVVPAQTADGATVVALVRAGAGFDVTQLDTTSRQPAALLTFDDTPAELVGAGDLAHALQLHWTAALALQTAGVCDAALDRTAKHTASREQFGKPIASFQAVGQRAADAYIDTQLVRLTALQAVWRLSEGWPADDEVAVAKFWAGDGGMRVVHACQHLHGGLGVDLDYPLHRYFVAAKQLEHTLGSPQRQLLTLGASLAATPV